MDMNEATCAVCNDPATHSESVDGGNVHSKSLGSFGPMTFHLEVNFCSRHSMKDYNGIELDPTL